MAQISLTPIPDDREGSFEQLIRIVKSAKFKSLLNRVFKERLYQSPPLQGEGFHKFLDKMDVELVWETEYEHYLKKGWLHASFPVENKAGILKQRKSISKVLENLHFHPYRILEAFNCSKNSAIVRSGWVIWHRRRKNKGEARKFALQGEDCIPSNPEWLDSLVDLLEILEAIHRPDITGRLAIHDVFNFERANEIIDGLKAELMLLTNEISESSWVVYHDYLCIIADNFYRHKELLALLALTRVEDRDRLVGKVGGAMVVLEAARCLRRHALEHGFKLEEEMFRGPGVFTNSYFTRSRGSHEIVDGIRSAKLKFVRGFGLDFSLRVRIYVEGATEYGCFKLLAEGLRYVEVIDLKGEFVQKNALAFRESLRNDKRSHIYSLIVLDSDVGDNARIVRLSASEKDFLGEFYLSHPDFETQNFSLGELVEIASQSAEVEIDQDKFVEVKSGGEFLKRLKKEYPQISLLKGAAWGELLAKYSINHPQATPIGLAPDRIINQVYRFCLFAKDLSFANDLIQKFVDPASGKMRSLPTTN